MDAELSPAVRDLVSYVKTTDAKLWSLQQRVNSLRNLNSSEIAYLEDYGLQDILMCIPRLSPTSLSNNEKLDASLMILSRMTRLGIQFNSFVETQIGILLLNMTDGPTQIANAMNTISLSRIPLSADALRRLLDSMVRASKSVAKSTEAIRDIMKLPNLDLPTDIHKLFLKGLLAQGRCVEAVRFITKVFSGDKSFKPVNPDFQDCCLVFLECVRYLHDRYAEKMLDDMSLKFASWDCELVVDIIAECVKASNLPLALNVHQLMLSKCDRVPLKAYAILLEAIASSKAPFSLNEQDVLDAFEQSGLTVNKEMNDILLKVRIKQRDITKVRRFFCEMYKPGQNVTVDELNRMLLTYMDIGDYYGVESLFSSSNRLYKLQPNTKSYNIIINGFIDALLDDEVQYYLNLMWENDVVPDEETVRCILQYKQMTNGAQVREILAEIDEAGIQKSSAIWIELLKSYIRASGVEISDFLSFYDKADE